MSDDRRSYPRTPVEGSAAILDLACIGVIYEILDLSHGGARLRGPRRPPESSFDVVLRVSERFLECRAHLVWDSEFDDGCLGIALQSSSGNLNSLHEPDSF